MKLLCVDGNSILNRAFYGIKLLTTKAGVYTNGIYGFLSILLSILGENDYDNIAIAFDKKGPTLRHEQFDQYKAGRKGMPDELASQLPVLKELLGYLGFTIVECSGYEADDILGTLSHACAASGGQCVIATGDRDALQLVGEHVQVRYASTKMGRPVTVVYGPDEVMAQYQVTPSELIDVKALMGDSSDNIPGVAGIGEKTAIGLIVDFHDLDNLYAHIDDERIRPAVRQKLTDQKEMAYLSRQLAQIQLDAPVPTDMDHYKRQAIDHPAAYHMLNELEIYSMIDKFAINKDERNVDSGPKAQKTFAVTDFVELFAGDDTIYLCWNEDFSRFAAAAGEKAAFFTKEEAGEDFLSLLSSDRPKAVLAAKSLYHRCINWGVEPKNIIFEPGLAGYLLNPSASGYDLERLFSAFGKEEILIPADDDDADLAKTLACLVAVCPAMTGELTQNGQEYLLNEVEIPLAGVLAAMEKEGFGIDKEELTAFGDMLKGEIATAQEKIFSLAGENFNIASPKQLGVILFEKLGLPAGKKTKTGYSTNADVLDFLKNKHPIIPLILEYRTLTKLNSTYVEGLSKVIAADGRIHTSFIQTETRTGRISSVEPNMQNIPVRTELGSRLRRFFKARPGYVLVDADYSQIELRVLAHMADDKTMKQAFEEGIDIHTLTASQVFDQPPLFVTPLMRSRAKAVNFGIVYGIGAFSLAQDIGVSVAEADHYIKEYLRTYAGVAKYMEDVVAFGKEKGYVETLYRRRRYLPELAASNKNLQAFGRRVAMNMPVQGTAADIIKIAMVKVAERLKEEKLDARLILQVHDELIVEAAVADCEKAKIILQQAMEGAANLAVPLSVDCHTGESWYDAK